MIARMQHEPVAPHDVRQFGIEITKAAGYLLLFLLLAAAPTVLRQLLPTVAANVSVDLARVGGLVAALFGTVWLFSRQWRKRVPAHWSTISAADALSCLVAVVLAFHEIRIQLTNRQGAYWLAGLLTLIPAVPFVVFAPRLEAIVPHLRPQWHSGQGPVHLSQLLVGLPLLLLSQALTPSNIIAGVIASLGLALAFPAAPASASWAWILSLIAFFLVWEVATGRVRRSRRAATTSVADVEATPS